MIILEVCPMERYLRKGGSRKPLNWVGIIIYLIKVVQTIFLDSFNFKILKNEIQFSLFTLSHIRYLFTQLFVAYSS